MEETIYDLMVVGAGPGGYVAAERAGEAGLKVLLVERAHLGGVCTNSGCIPTKALLNAAKHYRHAKEGHEFGVQAGLVQFDLIQAMAWKNQTIDTLRKGIAYLMKKNKVEVIQGQGVVEGSGRLRVGDRTYQGKNIILATGSSAFVPPIPGADLPQVLDNRGILEIGALPEHLAVIGGGVIGLEFASFFSSVGVKVTVVEMMDEILPMMDPDFAQTMRKSLPGVEFVLGAKVTAIEARRVLYQKAAAAEVAAAGGNPVQTAVDCDLVLMAVGRRPVFSGLENAGLATHQGWVTVDEQMRTNLPGVYAIGDLTGRSLLAHSASRMAEVAVNTILGRPDRMRYQAIPWALYTLPEASGVGLTESQARARALDFASASVQMRANGRFLAEYGKQAPGLCKVLVDRKTTTLLGVHLLGAVSSEMIWGAAALMEAELTLKEIKEIVFPHPSVGEVIKDALWALDLH